MSANYLSRPVTKAVCEFLAVMAAIMALVAGTGMGWFEPAFVRQAVGVLLGIAMVAMGNLLPKMRPLSPAGRDPAGTAAAERFAGWLLVLAGIAHIAAFLILPLPEARPVSAVIGIAAIVVIGVSWARLARGALSRAAPVAEADPVADKRARAQRQVVFALLFGLFYLLTTAGVKSLVDDRSALHDYAAWMLLGLCMAYAVVGSAWCRRSES